MDKEISEVITERLWVPKYIVQLERDYRYRPIEAMEPGQAAKGEGIGDFCDSAENLHIVPNKARAKQTRICDQRDKEEKDRIPLL